MDLSGPDVIYKQVYTNHLEVRCLEVAKYSSSNGQQVFHAGASSFAMKYRIELQQQSLCIILDHGNLDVFLDTNAK